MSATRRRCNNLISGIQDETGQWKQQRMQIDAVILKYFKEIYYTSNPTGKEVVNGVSKRISAGKRVYLDKEFTKVEIKKAIS